MAKHTRTYFSDDIDGSEEDVRTVTFSVDARTWEIDLSPANQEQLMTALAPFTTAGRSKNRKRGPNKPKSS